MSYPPPAGGFAEPPAKTRPGGLPGLSVLLIADLVLELAILGYDLNQKGAAYLTTAAGFTYSTFANGPVGFFGSDFAACVALITMIIAGFGGRGWIRPAGALLLSVNAYGMVQVISAQFTGYAHTEESFTKPTSNLLLNLDVIAQMLLALAFVIVVAATRGPARTARPAFVPGQPGAYQGWQQPQFGATPQQQPVGYPAPQQQQQPQPPVGYPTPQQQQQPAAFPQQPPQPPQPGYAPPPPPSAPPQQQPQQQQPGYGYPAAPTDAPPAP